MDCERLNKMIRTWYMQVQDETLAPARMVEFMEKHVLQCDTCLMDANVRAEIKKITAIVLPPSKMTKPPKSNKPPVIPPGYPPPPEPMEPLEDEEEETSEEQGDEEMDEEDVELDEDTELPDAADADLE